MTTKPQLSFWQIWNMCFGFLGIQFGFALQNANVSRIFQTLGASMDDIPMLWIAAPLTGLIVQPIVGYLSDRTWTAAGPAPPVLPGRRDPRHARAVRDAELADAVDRRRPAVDARRVDQHLDGAVPRLRRRPAADRSSAPRGYAMQSFFIGIGAVIASLLPWLLAKVGVGNTAARARFPTRCATPSTSAARCCCCAVGWTVLRTREYPPERAARLRRRAAARRGALREPRRARRRNGLVWLAVGALGCVAVIALRGSTSSSTCSPAGSPATAWRCCWSTLTQPRQRVRAHHRRPARHAGDDAPAGGGAVLLLVRAVRDVDLHHGGGDRRCTYGSSDTASAAYNEGANWVGVLFAAYNGFAALAAIVIPWMVRRFGLRMSHLINVCARRPRPAVVPVHPRPALAAAVDGRRRLRLGLDPVAAVRAAVRQRCRRRRWACTWASSISSS